MAAAFLALAPAEVAPRPPTLRLASSGRSKRYGSPVITSGFERLRPAAPAAGAALAVLASCGLAVRRQARQKRLGQAWRRASPRFAPDDDGSQEAVSTKKDPFTSGPTLNVNAPKKLARWAPGGSASDVSDAGLGSQLDKVSEEVIPGNGRCFRVSYDAGIGIRTEASVSAKRTGEDIARGTVFEIKTEVRRAGRRYFELLEVAGEPRGWVFDWNEIEGERVELVTEAAQLYTVIFPDGVNGIGWCSDSTMRFASVQSFTNEASDSLLEAGVRQGDILVLINEDPVIGMPFGEVLERLWATTGKQPGAGLFYKVTTTGEYGIGIRKDPDIDSERTGDDLLRGTIFQVDEIVEVEDGPSYLHLADDRGWVFDTTPIDPENGSCISLSSVEPGCTLTFWRGDVKDLADQIGLKFKQDLSDGQPFQVTVVEEGQPIQRIPVQPGTNLRSALMKNGFQVYKELRAVFNCNAQQLCGTCVLDVMEGGENLTVKSVNEQGSMVANPPSFRLCCNIDVYGDVTVRLRPGGIKYGGGTS
ncbi:unnamed protein product [Polarella glacialis]|uniref:2Fe-2S ferredoxin-type domain-containing protein n=2 Tax=Polarella glacialis TaxID=89957 RepID=A0A813LLB1_POLGL|nr:unnamed protein product [Polarella glacialis]